MSALAHPPILLLTRPIRYRYGKAWSDSNYYADDFWLGCKSEPVQRSSMRTFGEDHLLDDFYETSLREVCVCVCVCARVCAHACVSVCV